MGAKGKNIYSNKLPKVKEKPLNSKKNCSTPKELLNSKRAAQLQKSCSTPKEPLNSKRAAQLQKSRSTQKELSTLKSHTTHSN
jgi:hypothetical protein